MTEPESRFFESARLRIHYLAYGDETKPPVVFVHGSRDHARSWDFVAERLLDRYSVYAMDLRGHGDSGLGAPGTGVAHEFCQPREQPIGYGLAPAIVSGL